MRPLIAFSLVSLLVSPAAAAPLPSRTAPLKLVPDLRPPAAPFAAAGVPNVFAKDAGGGQGEPETPKDADIGCGMGVAAGFGSFPLAVLVLIPLIGTPPDPIPQLAIGAGVIALIGLGYAAIAAIL